MGFDSYDIHFSGQIMQGQDKASVQRKIGELFKVGEKQLQQLFSGTSVLIKQSVDMPTAIKYREVFRNAGALIEITKTAAGSSSPATTAHDVPKSRQNKAAYHGAKSTDSGSMTLAPPRSGSLEDCAPSVIPAEIPDISGLGLAPVGQRLPSPPEPPPPDISISGLEMFPAKTGSLIDCEHRPEPVPIPDVSRLTLADREAPGE